MRGATPIVVPSVLALLAVTAACSSPRCRQRGWVGGDFERVCARGGLLDPDAPACTVGKVIGIPPGVPAERGLLLLRAGPNSPLTRAGLREGDLVVALDGAPVGDPSDFRRAVETRPPGSTLALDVWRDGAVMRVPVAVGRETYESETILGLYLGASPHCDLWPFDDGVDVFGLVVAKSNATRYDLDGPRREYLAKAVPGKQPGSLRQETVRVQVLPLSVGTRNKILAQVPTVVPAR